MEFGGQMIRAAALAVRQAKSASEEQGTAGKVSRSEAVAQATGLAGEELSRVLDALDAVGPEVDDVLSVHVLEDEEDGAGIRIGGRTYVVERAVDAPVEAAKRKRSRKKESALPPLVKIVRAADRQAAAPKPVAEAATPAAPAKEKPLPRGRFTVDGKLVQGPRAGWTGPVPMERPKRPPRPPKSPPRTPRPTGGRGGGRGR